MTGYITIRQASALSDLPTVASGDFLISAINDDIVMKDDGANVLYYESYRSYTQQTTDATNTVPSGAYVAVAEGQVVLVQAKVIARQSTLASALGVSMWVIARRASGGNVTLVGSVQGTVQEDNGAAPTFTLVADTVNQRVNAQVTGVAAETWNWTVRIRGLIY